MNGGYNQFQMSFGFGGGIGGPGNYGGPGGYGQANLGFNQGLGTGLEFQGAQEVNIGAYQENLGARE